jgi:hypothetical protein
MHIFSITIETFSQQWLMSFAVKEVAKGMEIFYKNFNISYIKTVHSPQVSMRPSLKNEQIHHFAVSLFNSNIFLKCPLWHFFLLSRQIFLAIFLM